MFDQIKAFENKLIIWNKHLLLNNRDLKYLDHRILSFNIFSTPFNVDVERVQDVL